MLSSPASPFRLPLTRGGARRRSAAAAAGTITMRDRSKNRKPTQRGRYLSTEAIQAVQSLKRAALRGGSAASAAAAVEPKLRRLLKADMVAVFRELAAQGEALLALQVFEEIRKEHWYKPRLLWYVDLVTVLASKGFRSEVDKACSYLKREQLEPDTEGFNLLLKALLDAGFTQLALDCFRLMKLWDSDPDRITYATLIKGLESLGKMELCAGIRLEAENDYGSLDFLHEVETEEACASSS